MNTDTWRKIDGCLAEALEMPAAQRRDYLLAQLADDPEAAFEACKLADCADDAERLFSHSPVAKYTGYSAGSRIGPWELVKPLGSGGMGVVWMARRVDGQAAMLAAIKLLPTAYILKDSELEQRFLVEKQILARLDHPNIARLLDAGAGGGETPNFVMEYVDGEPLLEYLAARGMDRDAKLRLFLKICDAVQYAHGNLTIHRDLKPHNILVQSNGEPKLLDFGIGKILNESAGGGSVTLHRAFSIDYASPEQIRGGNISTSTDIFSLGLILFETVTGERARRWNDKALGEVLELSDQFSLAVEHPSISRDLAAVIRKATIADPELRYRTVSELAADVDRALDGRPVEARPAGLLYQASCFARRNKLAVGATAAALFAIVALGSWGWISAQQARREQAVAQQQTRLLQAALTREEAALRNETEARRSADQQRQQAELQADLARKFAELAQAREQQAEDRLRSMLNIFERTLYSARNDVTKLAGGTRTSIQLIERALSQLKEVQPSASGRPYYLALQADAHGLLAQLYNGSNSSLGQEDKASANLQTSVDLWREVNQLAPGRLNWQRSELDARVTLSRKAPFDPKDLRSVWFTLEREYLNLVKQAPKDQFVLRGIGSFYFWRAHRQLQEPNREGRQVDMMRSLEYLTKTLDEKDPSPTALRDVALGNRYLSQVSFNADLKTRLQHASEAVRLDRRRVALDATNANARMDFAFSSVALADVAADSGDHAGSQKAYWESYQTRKALWTSDPENILFLRGLTYPVRRFGSMSIAVQDWAGLRAAFQELTWVRSLPRATLEKVDDIGLTYWKGTLAENADGDIPAACGHYRDALRFAQGVKPEYYATGWMTRRLATCPAPSQ